MDHGNYFPSWKHEKHSIQDPLASIGTIIPLNKTILYWANYEERLNQSRAPAKSKPRIKGKEINAPVGFDFVKKLNSEMIGMLTDAGYSILPGDIDNAIFKAIRDGNLEMVQELLTKTDMMEEPRNCITPLHIATFYKNIDITTMLLSSGAKLLRKDGCGETSVDYIIHRYEDLTMFSRLFPFIEVTEKCAILFLVIQRNIPDFIEFLAKQSIDNQASDGYFYLHEACRNGDKRSVELALEIYGDPDVVDKDGKTALQLACSLGAFKVMQILLNYGADLVIPEDKGLRFVRNMSTELDVQRVLLNHCVRLKAANLYVSSTINDKHFELWKRITCSWLQKGYEKFETFVAECKNEVEMMKNEKIVNSWKFYLYDILAGDERCLMNIAGYECLMKTLRSKLFRKKYPHYIEMMIGRFKMAKVRWGFYVECRRQLQTMFPRLPLLCIEQIMRHFSTADMRRISSQT